MTSSAGRGLADVVAARTAISDADGRTGVLSYRGYDVTELAGRTTYEETAHLLQRGSLPTAEQSAAYAAELADARADLGPAVELLLPALAGAAPMDALRTLVSALAAGDPDTADSTPAADRRKAARLVAQTPVLVARHWALHAGGEPVDPDPELGIAGNLLLQLTGVRPDAERLAIAELCLLLHADHTMNASTFAARVCAATLAGMHPAVTAAVGAVSGPLHGSGTAGVLRTLESVGEPEAAPRALRRLLDRGDRVMGFGHRLYRTEDPRTPHLRAASATLAELTGDGALHAVAARVEQEMAELRGIRPNVDFYAAVVYQQLGVPVELATPVFAVARMAGWTAHVVEQHADNRLIRPESQYIGPKRQHWMPVVER